jgi:hypothetical protein
MAHSTQLWHEQRKSGRLTRLQIDCSENVVSEIGHEKKLASGFGVKMIRQTRGGTKPGFSTDLFSPAGFTNAPSKSSH